MKKQITALLSFAALSCAATAVQAVEREGVYFDVNENVQTNDSKVYNTQLGLGYKAVDEHGIFEVRGSGLYQKGYGDESDSYDHGNGFALDGMYKSPLLGGSTRILAGARWQISKDEYTNDEFSGDIRGNGYTFFGGAQFDLNPSLRLQALASWGRSKATYDKALFAGSAANDIFNDDPEGDIKTTGLAFRLEYDVSANWTINAAAGFYRTSYDNIEADLTPMAAAYAFGDASATRVWMEGSEDIRYSEYSIGARYQF
ncbi:hypothetical protein R0381_000670 [Jeongeupia wiesaeckerbachi]|uniref:hypothetical protein n=1 Tax=Jeongeupia wiesaeckerbachi TaxID=3051218 RepID=UPI003D807B7F